MRIARIYIYRLYANVKIEIRGCKILSKLQIPKSLYFTNLLCKRTNAVLRSCNLLYRAIHVDCLPARSASPPMAIECVDYDLALLLEFSCQVRRYQPPLENLVVRIDKGIHVFLVDFTCTDEFLDHFVLPVKHM